MKTAFLVTTLLACKVAYGAFSFGLSTDNSGNPTDFTWSGGGTIQSNVSTTGATDIDTLISGATSGTLGLNSFTDYGGLLNGGLTADVEINITGGNRARGNVVVANTTNFDGNTANNGATQYNNLLINNLRAASQLEVTITYSQMIAGRITAPGNLQDRPWLAGLGLSKTGSSTNPDDYNITAAIGEIASSPTFGGTFTPGVPANAQLYASTEWDSVPAGASTYSSNDGFNDTVTLGSSSHDFLLARGYDYDGSGGYQSSDAFLVYAYQIKYTITSDNGRFDNDAEFIFSFDGEQYANTPEPVPEPSSLMLSGLGIFLCALRRRRSA